MDYVLANSTTIIMIVNYSMNSALSTMKELVSLHGVNVDVIFEVSLF